MKVVQIILAVVFLMGIQTVSAQAKKEATKDGSVVFKVNVDCHSCEQKIKKNIPFERGVRNVTVNLEKQQVAIEFQPNRTNKDKLKQAIVKLGFTCEEVVQQPAVQQSTKRQTR